MKKGTSTSVTPESFYAGAGVDIDAGDALSKIAAEVCRSTYQANPYIDVFDLSSGTFRGPKGFGIKRDALPENVIFTAGADGVGTGVIIATAAGKQHHSAWDLIAMCADDIVRWGGMPALFLNVLDVKSLGKLRSRRFRTFSRILLELGAVSVENDIAVFNGEIAELGDGVTSEIRSKTQTQYNWCGTAIGLLHPRKLLMGEKMKRGDVVVALHDTVRSNGKSALRRYFRDQFGKQWWLNPHAQALIEEAATPSKIYTKLMNWANGWKPFDLHPPVVIHAFAHLTGGGMESKFRELLLKPAGLSAELNDLFPPAQVVENAIFTSGMPMREAYTTFCCGQGALVVLPDNNGNVQTFLDQAEGMGYKARIAGAITEAKSGSALEITSWEGHRFTYED